MLDVLDKSLQFIFFGGKGGVGKTTCAAAMAVHLAKLKPDKRMLLITTDPARALNRMLDIPLTDQPTLIEGFSNLWAQEIDAKKANEAYREQHWTQLAEITYRSSPIYDAEDSVNLTRLEAPGVDEVIALKKIVEFRKSQQYDLVIVDTAPTGHTLTLLRIMGKGEKRADKWIDTQYRHRMVRAAIRMGHRRHFGFKRGFVDRCYLKDDVDEFLDEQKKDARLVKDTLTDRQRTEFICITIPEAMGMLETYDLIEGLRGLNVKGNKIIVNRVNLQASKLNCSFCHARREREAKYIDELKERFPHHKLIKMPLFPYEIRGLNSVEEFGDILFGKSYEFNLTSQEMPTYESEVNLNCSEDADYGLNVLDDKLQLIIFGGKGGVGKTTCAAAMAVHLAKLKPDKRILVISTDPAHSLSDSFVLPLADQPTPIEGFSNLWGMEINAEKEWNTWKNNYKKEIDHVFDDSRASRSQRIHFAYEKRGLKDQLDLAPSVDEMMAILKIQRLLEKGEFDRIVLDTAPTGHLIRFLEMPQILDGLITTYYRLQRKYQNVRYRSRNLAVLLLEMKKNIQNIRELLSDPLRTLFVSVTIPEAMGLLETRELLKIIGKLQIKCRNLVINNVNPANPCPFCTMKRASQLKYVEQYRKEFPKFRTIELPLFPHEITGINDLTQYGNILCSN